MKLLTAFLFGTCLLFAACGDDDDVDPGDCNSLEFSREFEDEINAITLAVTNFSQDPSDSNCNALQDAYNNYIDELEDWETCAIALNQRTEWRNALDEARESVDDIC